MKTLRLYITHVYAHNKKQVLHNHCNNHKYTRIIMHKINDKHNHMPVMQK